MSEPAPERSSSFTILGCGAVGTALAAALARAGHRLALWSRTEGRAARLAAALRAAWPSTPEPRVLESPGEALGAPDSIALLCVADGALEEFARRLAEGARPAPGACALHTCGAAGLEVLEPLAGTGVGVGRLHPLAAVPPAARGTGREALESAAEALSAAWFAVAARSSGEEGLDRTLRALGARAWRLPGEAQAARAVHAAAALLSGGTVALFEQALGSLEDLGAGARQEGRAALLGLLRSTLGNLERTEPREALTGPVARGAAETVRAHLERLDAVDPESGRLYRLLGRRMLRLARERGGVPDAQDLERLLEPPTTG